MSNHPKSLGTRARLREYRTSPLFSDRERAGLTFVEEATRQRRVSDATVETPRRHFSEWAIVEITWLNAVHNYYNLINVRLELESDGFCAIAETRMASPNGASGGSGVARPST